MSTKTIYISGMMCNGCKNHVQTTLENMPEVLKAEVDLKCATAKIEFNSPLDFVAFKKQFESASEGYSIFESEEELQEAKKKV